MNKSFSKDIFDTKIIISILKALCKQVLQSQILWKESNNVFVVIIFNNSNIYIVYNNQ